MMMNRELIANKINAGNDVNGNPRRAYIVQEILENTNYASTIDVIDEGYEGSTALFNKYPDVRWSGLEVPTTVKAYKTLLKQYNK